MISSRRYAWIGLFVVGSLLIAAVGTALFMGGGFGRTKVNVLMVFHGNVTGLELGTPVQFRGMKIGEVKRVRTIYDPESKQVLFPVYAEFTGTIEIPGYDNRKSSDGVRSAWIAGMVEQGLRAQLQTKSFVTGQQMIMLDFASDGAPQFSDIEKNLLEIPTKRSPNEAIVDALRELPVREIVFEGQKLLAQVNRLMLATDGTPGPLPQMLEQFTLTGQALQKNLPKIGDQANATGRDLRATLGAISKTSGAIDKQVHRAVDNLNTTLAEIQKLAAGLQGSANQAERGLGQTLGKVSDRLNESLEKLDRTTARLEFSLSEDSNLGAGLTNSLNEAASAAQALKQAVESLNRRPTQLLFGHPAP
jgi:paraquat-inducible protein B